MFEEVLVGKAVRHHTAWLIYVCLAIATDSFEEAKSSAVIRLAQ